MRSYLLALFVIVLAGCNTPPGLVDLSGVAQGTTWNVRYVASGKVESGKLHSLITKELARLDSVLSNYRNDSAIEQFNADTSLAPVAVEAEIVTLVKIARTVHQASTGCYDLTIRPLFDLWGFGADQLTVPSQAELASIRSVTGMGMIRNADEASLQKGHPDVRVDLSSIAQGYSVARIAALMEQQGLTSYLVEIGGELQVTGTKPDGSPWRIGIERPLPGDRQVQKAITINRTTPTAIMTSGTYRHYFDKEGTRYSHVLDARTGKPIEHKTVSVTVISDDPTLADAWSTALLCLGREQGVAIANKHEIAALFIEHNAGGLTETKSNSLKTLVDIEIH